MSIRSEGHTDVGNKRSNNEDAYLEDPNFNIWAVADGLGGHANGELASAEAIEQLMEVRDPEKLKPALLTAHKTCREARDGRSTTATALLLDGTQGHLVHCGDTRLYALNDNWELTCLTHDHGHGHMLYSCLGMSVVPGLYDLKIDTDSWKHEPGTTYLLTTDGVHDVLGPRMSDIVKEAMNEQRDAAEALCNEAMDAGSTDNVTAVVVWT